MSGAAGSRFAGSSSPALSVTINDVIRVGRGAGTSGIVTTVQLPNTSVTGGVGPYTVLWENIGGSPDPTINTPASLNPTWTALVEADNPVIGNYRVTVTDSLGAIATAENEVSLFWVQL